MKTIEQHLQEIAAEFECSVEDLKGDPHSVADALVDRGVLSEDEAMSDLGFAQVRQWCGLPGGY